MCVCVGGGDQKVGNEQDASVITKSAINKYFIFKDSNIRKKERKIAQNRTLSQYSMEKDDINQ